MEYVAEIEETHRVASSFYTLVVLSPVMIVAILNLLLVLPSTEGGRGT